MAGHLHMKRRASSRALLLAAAALCIIHFAAQRVHHPYAAVVFQHGVVVAHEGNTTEASDSTVEAVAVELSDTSAAAEMSKAVEVTQTGLDDANMPAEIFAADEITGMDPQDTSAAAAASNTLGVTIVEADDLDDTIIPVEMIVEEEGMDPEDTSAAAAASNTLAVTTMEVDDAHTMAIKAQNKHRVAHRSYVAAVVVFLITLLVAKTEAAVPQPSPVPLEARPDYYRIMLLNALMSLTAGMLNALAFLEMSATIAHHSGNLTHWGRSWGSDSFRFGCYLFAFMFGGAVVGFVKADYEGVFVGRFSPSMLSAFIAVLGGLAIRMIGGEELPALALWAFALGVQNGLCRKFSSMPLCSTHFTGYLTDAGNFVGVWMRSKVMGGKSPNMMKCALFIACMLSFAAGGFAAKLGRDMFGVVVGIVPAILMASVAIGVLPVAVSAKRKV